MVIDFEQLNEMVIPNFKGGEKDFLVRMYSDQENKILMGKLIPGATIGAHVHDESSEIIYFLSGTGKVLSDGEYEVVSKGICHYCPKGHSHGVINDGSEDLVFFAVVPRQ